MDIKEMLYVTAIAREGSLTAAGRKLHVSQPTLSNFLSTLETQLGTSLFLREKKQLIPTHAGQIYIDAAMRILEVREQTYRSIYQVTHEPTETILVGATPLRGSIMVAQIFPQFNRRYPNVKLQIREAYMGELRTLVKNGEVNCALGSLHDSENPDLDYIIVSKEEIVLGVPVFHRLAPLASGNGNRLASIDIGELYDTPFIMLASGTTIRTISDTVFARAGFRPTIVFETNNNLVLSNMIRQGAGAGLLPRSAMVQDAADIVYFSLSPKYYLELSILLRKGHVLTEAERYFAYLVISRDKDNPLYVPSMNTRARKIYQEFERE